MTQRKSIEYHILEVEPFVKATTPDNRHLLGKRIRLRGDPTIYICTHVRRDGTLKLESRFGVVYYAGSSDYKFILD